MPERHKARAIAALSLVAYTPRWRVAARPLISEPPVRLCGPQRGVRNAVGRREARKANRQHGAAGAAANPELHPAAFRAASGGKSAKTGRAGVGEVVGGGFRGGGFGYFEGRHG